MSFYPIESAGDGAWGRSTNTSSTRSRIFQSGGCPTPIRRSERRRRVEGWNIPACLFDGLKQRGKISFGSRRMRSGTVVPDGGWLQRGGACVMDEVSTPSSMYTNPMRSETHYGPKRDPSTPRGAIRRGESCRCSMTRKPRRDVARDAIEEKYRHPVSYFKSALGLVLLREQILDRSGFDWTFRKFIAILGVQAPSPSDFFAPWKARAARICPGTGGGWYKDEQLDARFSPCRTCGSRRQRRVTIENRGGW